MRKVAKPVLFILCLLPLTILIVNAVSNRLGANPIEAITHFTGIWALRFLLITLAITPLRRLTRINQLISYRRMLGLFAFFYVCLHFLTYVVLDHFFDWHAIGQDIIKRPYITVGFLAFVLLIPLAVTSTNNMVRRLGSKWRQLHHLIYPVGILAILHFLWLVKADLLEPAIYGLILLGLLILRLPGVRFPRF